MKIILKYILTNIKERKLRTAVMFLSVLLSSMLLFVSFSIGASYESAQQKMARGMAGSAVLSVRAADRAVGTDEIPPLPSIDAGVGVLKGSALYHEDGYYETVDLLAADLTQLDKINPPHLANGEKITDFTGSQVILPDRFTSKYGIKKGDTIHLQINGTPVPLRVADIANYDTGFLRHTRGVTALLPLSTLAGLLDQTDGYSEILIKPVTGADTAALKRELSAALPAPAYHVSETVNQAQIEADARQKSMPFFLISFFSLTMSVFIIYSSYKVITLDRLPVIGTFRSIGAEKKTVTCIFLLESLLYGSAGGLLGIPAGTALLKLILHGMGQSLTQGIEIPAVVSPLYAVFSLAAAVISAFLSAWLPIRRAGRLPVKDIVLGTVEEPRTSVRFLSGVCVLLFLVSALLPRLVSGPMRYPAGGFSLLGMIAAAVLLVPTLTNLCSAAFTPLFCRFLGNEGWLAARNMRDNKNTAQNITLLFISISAVTAITVVGNFVTSYVSDVFAGAELDGFADGHMEPEFISQLKDMEGIEKVLPLYVFNGRMTADGIPLNRLEATDRLDWYGPMMALHYSEKDMEASAISAFASGRAVILSTDCMERTGSTVGGLLSLSDGTVQQDYLIAGSFKSRATDVEAVIPSACAVSDFGASSYGFAAYTAADPDAIMVQLRSLFGETSNWSRTVEEFNTDALTTVGTFLKPMHSMTWFILLLAAVGVVNNLLIGHIQKRRSTAMYQSIGLSNRQMVKITVIESVSAGLISAVLAVFISYMEIQTIFLVAGPKIQTVPELDASVFLTSGLLGIVVTLLGSVVPVVKSRNMKLVEEIKVD